MKHRTIGRWLRLVICGGLACCVVDALLIEPHWLKIERVALSEHPSLRIVHVSDLHYKGDRAYLEKIVRQVNGQAADVVCFTGDIVENVRYLKDALDGLAKIRAPLYGVPGNHEDWSKAPVGPITACFRQTGGAWLVDRSTVACAGNLLIVGKSGVELLTRRAASEFAMPKQRFDGSRFAQGPLSPTGYVNHAAVEPGAPGPATASSAKRILLIHYPAVVDGLEGESYDLIIAGHAHGGQVRLPFIGAPVLPFGVGRYDIGMFATSAGPLHVSSGLGTFFLPIRFRCRPEITVIQL